jgi:ATP-dependent DNA ligase
MGCLEQKARDRQEKGDKLHYYIFDVWAFDGESFLKTKIEDRIYKLNVMWRDHSSDYVEYAEYSEGKALWDELGCILRDGGEGIVMTKKGTHPEPGKRPARKTLKVKKEINQTIDCIFTGVGAPPTRPYQGKEIETWKYWENVRTGEKMEGDFYKEFTEGAPIEPVTKPYFHGWVSSLEIGLVKGKKVVPIGFISGLTDDVKANHQKYKGLPIEVTCMEILPTGGLRHAKLVRFRPDLAITDCTWEKVFGEDE